MRLLNSIGRSAMRFAGALASGLDAVTRVVARANGRVEAHLMDRTQLLRARYARTSQQQARPLPVLDAPIDQALRAPTRAAA